MIVISHEILGAIDTDRHRAYRIKVGFPSDPLLTVYFFALKKYYGQGTGKTPGKMLFLSMIYIIIAPKNILDSKLEFHDTRPRSCFPR